LCGTETVFFSSWQATIRENVVMTAGAIMMLAVKALPNRLATQTEDADNASPYRSNLENPQGIQMQD
jgi:hypothetical protein